MDLLELIKTRSSIRTFTDKPVEESSIAQILEAGRWAPTPMTTSTCLYYTGLDPFSGKPVHVPKGEERSFQKALLQPQLEKNYRQVAKALKLLHRSDLIAKLTEKRA